jgi:NAD+--asparagine ADP-ribosyltransferase
MLKKGRTTRFRSNYHPELSVRGYVKYQFNTETHRNYLSKHRSSDVQSAEYSQEFYIERGAKTQMNGKLEYEYFRLQKLEKMFWNRTYGHVRIIYFSEKPTDANGKCTMQDEKVRIFQLRWCYQADRKIL